MFRFDDGLKVYLHREPVDFRLSINGLAVLVEQALGLDQALELIGRRSIACQFSLEGSAL
ncbi:IS66 family insertion sequence element accessory protein TnpB [Pseudomonas sp.]|uniref:IS66 family insertion sequence element accessory protein TnpB n=1 Tax=Pseudomonas sp. TaxID=306 RepID=UPI0025CF8B4E|nr:IS66 family insertion sequence element accessory protein TnpB [Pseudomonas sp.]